MSQFIWQSTAAGTFTHISHHTSAKSIEFCFLQRTLSNDNINSQEKQCVTNYSFDCTESYGINQMEHFSFRCFWNIISINALELHNLSVVYFDFILRSVEKFSITLSSQAHNICETCRPTHFILIADFVDLYLCIQNIEELRNINKQNIMRFISHFMRTVNHRHTFLDTEQFFFVALWKFGHWNPIEM